MSLRINYIGKHLSQVDEFTRKLHRILFCRKSMSLRENYIEKTLSKVDEFTRKLYRKNFVESRLGYKKFHRKKPSKNRTRFNICTLS
jgi:hypothetical protein